MLDLFLFHPKFPGHLFNVQTEVLKCHLVFVVTGLIWNEMKQDNDEKKSFDLNPEIFAQWYNSQLNDGWRIQK